jgi:hypothetical protein
MNDFYEYTYMFYNLQENRRPMPFHRCRVSRAIERHGSSFRLPSVCLDEEHS